jgi:iron complex outermembrane receptor protein
MRLNRSDDRTAPPLPENKTEHGQRRSPVGRERLCLVQRRVWLASASMAAVCVGLAATPAAARQQPAPSDNSEAVSEVVVTGFRSSLAKALNVKREESAPSTPSWPRTSASSPTSTSRNPSSASRAWPWPATAAKVARSRCGAWAPVHPRAHQRHGSPDHRRRLRRRRRHQSRPLVRLQRLRVGPLHAITVRKTAEAATEEGSLGATVDLRTARPSTITASKWSARPRPATTTWPSRPIRAAPS